MIANQHTMIDVAGMLVKRLSLEDLIFALCVRATIWSERNRHHNTRPMHIFAVLLSYIRTPISCCGVSRVSVV